jgi:hypothetical protein
MLFSPGRILRFLLVEKIWYNSKYYNLEHKQSFPGAPRYVYCKIVAEGTGGTDISCITQMSSMYSPICLSIILSKILETTGSRGGQWIREAGGTLFLRKGAGGLLFWIREAGGFILASSEGRGFFTS